MNLLNNKKNKTENNKQYIYRVLKENIMNLILIPGENISESEICEELNVSRTPVREAIVRLSEEKLLNVFPQKGSRVSKINLNLVEEAIFLRELCEKELFKMVCEDENSSELIKALEKNVAYQNIAVNFDEDLYEFFRLDNQFHMIIFEHYNKKNVWQSIKRLCTHYDRLRLLDTLEKMNLQEIINQHMEIIEIFRNRDKEKIESLISKHLCNYKEVINIFIKKHPSYFEE